MMNPIHGSRDVIEDLFVPKSIQWKSMQLLSGLERNDIVLPEGTIANQRDMLWNDLCSEYNARIFSEHLYTLGHEYTQEFLEFISAW